MSSDRQPPTHLEHSTASLDGDLPLIVDLDGTFLRTDTLYELFAVGLAVSPLQTIAALFQLVHGIAAFKQRLAANVRLDIDTLPIRADFLAYLEGEAARGREIHLATAADFNLASAIAARFPIFKTVNGTAQGINLKAEHKAKRLRDLFPGGFAYAGNSTADLAVWKGAKAAIVVSAKRSLQETVSASGIPIERVFEEKPFRPGVWLKALRPHQWMKNLVVLVPVALGWRDATAVGLLQTLLMIGLLCVVASMTYLVNDMADLASDRRHWSKRRRGFASGALPVRDGLLLVGILLPIACAAGFLVAPLAGLCLLFYVVVTLGYSFGWKRIPLFDTFIIALLFTIRILVGIAAADLVPSAWLLTFSMFFFFSLALAKRHTEILRAAEHGWQKLEGRGYRSGDESLTLAFGSAASLGSIIIVVIYMVEEVFARQAYRTPAWLWVAPIAIFLFSCRVWVLSHRGRMTDDPVAFALRDNVSLGLGVLVAIAILLAL
jgi:4-hydroxybenzoate polyprenyltransferase/phosphoserine phosphatase